MSEFIFKNATYHYPDFDEEILTNFSAEIPAGVTSIIGENGTGKSTILLLASGTDVPQSGDVYICGRNTKEFVSMEERQALVSFVFQNMEFESEELSGDLLRYVYENGFHSEKKESFLQELISVFELSNVLNRKTQEVSKGELQRIIMAFSLLYGSKNIIMDEPVFALEEYQKEKALEYISDYSRKNKMSFVFCAHELNLCEKYSDYACILFRDKHTLVGKTKDVLTKENIEAAYNVPLAMLKQKENLYRDILENPSCGSSKDNLRDRPQY